MQANLLHPFIAIFIAKGVMIGRDVFSQLDNVEKGKQRATWVQSLASFRQMRLKTNPTKQCRDCLKLITLYFGIFRENLTVF